MLALLRLYRTGMEMKKTCTGIVSSLSCVLNGCFNVLTEKKSTTPRFDDKMVKSNALVVVFVGRSLS